MSLRKSFFRICSASLTSATAVSVLRSTPNAYLLIHVFPLRPPKKVGICPRSADQWVSNTRTPERHASPAEAPLVAMMFEEWRILCGYNLGSAAI